MQDLHPVIRRYINAYNGMDVVGMVECLAPDVHFVNRTNGAVTVETRGRAAFEELALQAIALFSERFQTVEQLVSADTHAAASIAYRAVAARDLPNGWRAGEVIEIKGASFFRIDKGLIAEVVDIS